MPGNQLTNVQRALFLNELRTSWPHILKNPSDLASTIDDIRHRLNIPKPVSTKTARGYARDMGLAPLPKPHVATPAQLAALKKARAAINPQPTSPISDARLAELSISLTHISDALTTLTSRLISSLEYTNERLSSLTTAIEQQAPIRFHLERLAEATEATATRPS